MSEILSAFFGILFFFRHYSWFKAILQSFSFENTEKTPKNESLVLWTFDFLKLLETWKLGENVNFKFNLVFPMQNALKEEKLQD